MLDTFEALETPSGCEAPGIVPTGLALPTRTLEPGQVLYEADREAASLYVVNHGVLKAVVPTSLGRDRIADIAASEHLRICEAVHEIDHQERRCAAEPDLLPEFLLLVDGFPVHR